MGSTCTHICKHSPTQRFLIIVASQDNRVLAQEQSPYTALNDVQYADKRALGTGFLPRPLDNYRVHNLELPTYYSSDSMATRFWPYYLKKEDLFLRKLALNWLSSDYSFIYSGASLGDDNPFHWNRCLVKSLSSEKHFPIGMHWNLFNAFQWGRIVIV